VLSVDIYDEDQVHIYEPLIGGQALINVGTILKDSLPQELVDAVSENATVIVEINMIGIATDNARTRGQ
jgi:hypothetical protein